MEDLMLNNISRLTMPLTIGFCLIWFVIASAQEPFYKGKTIRVIVGFSAGGGFDTYARSVARHIGKHIPGNPTVVVENMAGAGSAIAASYVYKAKPDGLTAGNWIGSLILQQVIGEQKGIEFDGRKFEWIGVPVRDSNVCAVTKASGVASAQQWLTAKEPVKIGGLAPGTPNSDAPRILKAALNFPVQVVDGYKGTSDLRLAADSGEVDGGCWAWESIKVTWRKGLDSGNVKVVLQLLPKRHPELADVTNVMELARTEEARQLIKVGVIDPGAISRVYSLPPGTPKTRVKIWRDAFTATMADPEFLAEMKKANLDLDPVSGEEAESVVQGLFKISPTLIAKLRDIVVPKK
jgi:tripartite-type tricarboxylate transporter receptor subunit TctC